MKNLIHNKLKQ